MNAPLHVASSRPVNARGPYNVSARRHGDSATDPVWIYARRIGVLIQDRRLELGLTQRQLAIACGCTIRLITQIENGRAHNAASYGGPRLGTLIRISLALGVNPRELLP